LGELVKTEWTDGPSGGRIARVIINDPRRLNAMGRDLMTEFVAVMEAVSLEDDCRCVIVEGAGGKAFVGGANIFELGALRKATARAFLTQVHRCCDALRQCPVPVIAKVDGFCIGAGMELAAAADLRVASDTSVFGMPEVAVGLPSVVEASLFPGLIGWGRTRQMMLTGENIDAETAERWGFVEAVASKAALDTAVDRFVDPIVKAGPLAVRSQKALMRSWEAMSPVDAARAGIDALANAFDSDEPNRLIGVVVAELQEKRRLKGQSS
jgi:enoyl-CoA hydratase